jgi:hypothetical protein
VGRAWGGEHLRSDPFEPDQSVQSILQTAVHYLRVGAFGGTVRLCSTLLGTRRRILGSRLQSERKRKQETDNVLSQHVRSLVARSWWRGEEGVQVPEGEDPLLLSF